MCKKTTKQKTKQKQSKHITIFLEKVKQYTGKALNVLGGHDEKFLLPELRMSRNCHRQPRRSSNNHTGEHEVYSCDDVSAVLEELDGEQHGELRLDVGAAALVEVVEGGGHQQHHARVRRMQCAPDRLQHPRLGLHAQTEVKKL